MKPSTTHTSCSILPQYVRPCLPSFQSQTEYILIQVSLNLNRLLLTQLCAGSV